MLAAETTAVAAIAEQDAHCRCAHTYFGLLCNELRSNGFCILNPKRSPPEAVGQVHDVLGIADLQLLRTLEKGSRHPTKEKKSDSASGALKYVGPEGLIPNFSDPHIMGAGEIRTKTLQNFRK